MIASADLLHPAADFTEDTRVEHRKARRSGLSLAGIFVVGFVVLVVSVAFSVRIGTSSVGYAEIGRVVGVRLGLPVDPLPRLLDSLVWDLRFPRVLLAGLIGSMLAVCGAALQGVTNNALADPYLLGVSNGASAGAVTVIVMGAGGAAIGLTGGPSSVRSSPSF